MTTVPTFLVKDDTIVEIAYTEWQETSPGQWNLTGRLKIDLPGEINRIIYELPVGCFQTLINLKATDLTFIPQGTGARTANVEPCTQKAHFQDDNKQTEPANPHPILENHT